MALLKKTSKTIFLAALIIVGTLPVARALEKNEKRGLNKDAVRLGKLAADEKANGQTRDAALTHINEALKLDPRNAWLWYQKADILQKMEEDAEGLKCIEEAIRLSPGNADYWRVKATLYRYNGKKNEALAAAEQALKLDPANQSALGVKGKTLCDLKRFAEAEAVYDQLVEQLGSRSGIVRTARMVVCKAQRKWSKVVEDADFCLQYKGAKLLAKFNWLLARAEAYEELKNYPKAVADCQAALGCFKDNREPHKRLIRLYTLMGDKKRAVEETAMLREIDEDMSPPSR